MQQDEATGTPEQELSPTAEVEVSGGPVTDSPPDDKDADPKVLSQRLKDTQAALTQQSQRAADLQRQVDAMGGKLEAVVSRKRRTTRSRSSTMRPKWVLSLTTPRTLPVR
jgi:hypothetical protein